MIISLKKTMAERGGQNLEDLELRNLEHEDFYSNISHLDERDNIYGCVSYELLHCLKS